MSILNNPHHHKIHEALSLSPSIDQDEVKVEIQLPLPSTEVQSELISLWTKTFGWASMTFTPKGQNYEVTVTRAKARQATDSSNMPEVYNSSGWSYSGSGNSVMDWH